MDAVLNNTCPRVLLWQAVQSWKVKHVLYVSQRDEHRDIQGIKNSCGQSGVPPLHLGLLIQERLLLMHANGGQLPLQEWGFSLPGLWCPRCCEPSELPAPLRLRFSAVTMEQLNREEVAKVVKFLSINHGENLAQALLKFFFFFFRIPRSAGKTLW